MNNTIIISTLIFFFLINNAYAYLDPGSGSFLIQIIAGIAGSFFIFFNIIKDKISKLFSKKNDKKNKKK